LKKDVLHVRTYLHKKKKKKKRKSKEEATKLAISAHSSSSKRKSAALITALYTLSVSPGNQKSIKMIVA